MPGDRHRRIYRFRPVASWKQCPGFAQRLPTQCGAPRSTAVADCSTTGVSAGAVERSPVWSPGADTFNLTHAMRHLAGDPTTTRVRPGRLCASVCVGLLAASLFISGLARAGTPDRAIPSGPGSKPLLVYHDITFDTSPTGLMISLDSVD